MPKPGTGRPYPTHTKIGRMMADRGLTATAVSQGTGIYTRTMTEILSGRMRPSPRALAGLTTFLGVPAEAILEDSYPVVPQAVPA